MNASYSVRQEQWVEYGLKDLGLLCKRFGIPVRVVPYNYTGSPHWESVPPIDQAEKFFKHFFEGCDYEANFQIRAIESVPKKPVRVMVVGGMLRYRHFTTDEFEEVCKFEKIDPYKVERADSKGDHKAFAFIEGCVPTFGTKILGEIKPAKIVVYIDPVSSVGGLAFDPKSLYKLERIAHINVAREHGFIATKIPRDKLIPHE